MKTTNTLQKTIVLTLATIFTLSLASAAPAELNLFPEESDTRIDSFTEYELQVENIGTTTDSYQLSSPSKEVTIAPNQVELDPGQTKTVNVWYNPDWDKSEGRHSFQIHAKSRASGDRYTTTGYVNVIKDYNVELTVEPASQTSCRGENTEYQVTVENTGIQPDNIKLTTEEGELANQEFDLDADQTGTTTLSIESDEPVEKSFNVRAASQNVNYASDEENVEFNVETCYESELNIEPESQDIAAYTEGEYTVSIENLGTRTDTFTLSTDEGTLDQEEIQVEGHQTRETTLRYTPTELGTDNIQVNSEGVSSSSRTATAEVYNGMEVETSLQSEVSLCEDERNTVTATVENTGEAQDEYTLETTTGELETSEISLETGQRAEVDITVDGENYEEDSHNQIEFTATSNTFEETTHTSNTEFHVENCWDLEMNVVPEVQSAGENRSTIYEIRLENTGTKQNTYNLSYEGPEWISVRPETQTVEAGDRATSYMYAGIPFDKEEGEVQITARAEGREIVKNKTVQLHIGDEIEEEIRSPVNRITGGFLDRIPSPDLGITETFRDINTVFQILISVIIGLGLTALILFREW